MLVVLADVVHDLFVQVLDAGEDAACDHIALYLGKPNLHLVEPGRVGERVMDMHIGREQQPRLNQCGFVATHVVADHMDLLILVMMKKNKITPDATAR